MLLELHRACLGTEAGVHVQDPVAQHPDPGIQHDQRDRGPAQLDAADRRDDAVIVGRVADEEPVEPRLPERVTQMLGELGVRHGREQRRAQRRDLTAQRVDIVAQVDGHSSSSRLRQDIVQAGVGIYSCLIRGHPCPAAGQTAMEGHSVTPDVDLT